MEFELSATYIESLEKVSHEADFAVLVLTPDDVTTSREAEKLAPRDNVVFELGLFIGSLGRERCFLVHEQRPDLKLPSDLLGVKAATFKHPANDDLKAVLGTQCFLMSERIAKLSSRHKLSAHALAAQDAMRSFYEVIKGAWWERITVGDSYTISFFQIELDEPYNSAQLVEGRVYDAEGSLTALWNSAVTRVQTDEKRILYVRRCSHPGSNTSWLHGYGEMNFRRSAEIIDRGEGTFWDVDKGHPEKTAIRQVEIHRVIDKNEMLTMSTGNEKDVQSLVTRKLREW